MNSNEVLDALKHKENCVRPDKTLSMIIIVFSIFLAFFFVFIGINVVFFAVLMFIGFSEVCISSAVDWWWKKDVAKEQKEILKKLYSEEIRSNGD